MLKFFIVIIFLFFSSLLSAEDSLLTLKQKLDRLQREVDDISKLVFQSNRDSETVIKNQNNTNASDLTAFDLRIYDLEKDIKKLNSNFEELIFQIEDLNNLYNFFYVYSPNYYVWPLEIHYINLLIHVTQYPTKEQLKDLAHKYTYSNSALHYLSDDFKEKYYKLCLNVLNSYNILPYKKKIRKVKIK